MAKKLVDYAIGSDAHISLEVGDDGKLGAEVSYPLFKLRDPLISLLQKATTKVGFINRQVPNIVNGLFTSLGIAIESAPAPAAASVTGPAAHENVPVEPVAPQA